MTPEQFEAYRQHGEDELGFLQVVSSPLTRSSYHAGEVQRLVHALWARAHVGRGWREEVAQDWFVSGRAYTGFRVLSLFDRQGRIRAHFSGEADWSSLEARALIDASGRAIRLEIDGGVNVQNIREIAAAGADTFVAGSAIFNAPNYQEVIEKMRAELALARP